MLFIISSQKKKDILNNWGYKRGIIYGLIISAVGAFLMFPAVNGAVAGQTEVFYYVLVALFIVGLGFSLQQTGANPFAVSLGDPSTGSSRLNLAGGVNSFGTTIGPLVVAFIIFGSTPLSGDELKLMVENGEIQLTTIQSLYLGVGGFIFSLCCIFLFFQKVCQKEKQKISLSQLIKLRIC